MYGSAGRSSIEATRRAGGEGSQGREDGLSLRSPPPYLQAHQIPKKQNTLKKEFGVFTMSAIAINNILGSGIFITPALILKHSGSFGLSMVLWLVGGVITCLASYCYLELALLVGKSGSTYVYLKEAYSFGRRKPWMEGVGSMMSFLMVWTDVFIIEPVSGAIGLLVTGHYFCKAFFSHCQDTPSLPATMFALFTLILLVILNVYSVKMVARILNFLSSIKFLVFLFIVVLGAWKLIQNGSFPKDSQHPFEGSSTSFSDITLGLYGVMWAYDGWTGGLMVQEEATSITAIKWMMFILFPIVTSVYLLVNTAYFAVLSYGQIRSSEAVGLAFGEEMLGTAGVALFSVMAVLMMFTASQSGLYERSRELFVAAREGDMPKFISGIHVTYRTPVVSIVLQHILVAGYIMVGNLEALINVFNAVEWFWYGVGIFGLIIMRITLPNKHRPFKVILLLPSVMVVVSVLLVVLPLWQDPVPQLIGFAGVLAGLPVYALFVMKKPCRLKPKILDRIGDWLIQVSGKLFNTEIADHF